MMSSLRTLVFLAILSLANAASSTELDIEAIEAHFQGAQIVPSLLPTFTPGAILSLAFSGKDVSPGQPLAQADVAPKPVVSVSAVNATLTGTFTIAMVDADVVGTDESAGVSRHWLENGVTVSDGIVSNASATTITVYAGPGPAPGSGPHRYVVLLYAQPSTFTAPANLSTLIPGVEKFNLDSYVKESGLGDIVGGTYFTVEVGTDPTSLPATSPVVTSTLASVASKSDGASGPTGSTAAPASSPTGNGALTFKSEGAAFFIVAGLAVALLQ
ncbi:phosphatidylethanolamine-binding protein [Mycena amicta]|nr:phosphatidylethanolamine-binding protein [Mycena amicta]